MNKEATETVNHTKSDMSDKNKKELNALMNLEMSIDKAAILQYLQS